MPLHGRHRYFQRHLNRRIGLLFAGGSALFMLGGILSLSPALAAGLSLESSSLNTFFFAGSIPFTAAAYLQLFQAANAFPEGIQQPLPAASRAWFGCRPGDINWLGCALQFLGTLMFNVNTYDGMLSQLSWQQQNLAIWAPDMVGSALFLSSAYLAYVECWLSPGPWQPRKVVWWICVINLLGCIAFMLSAVLTFFPEAGQKDAVVSMSLLATVIGAAAFLSGGLMMLPELVEP
jgi:hypothetical protein